jgi:predicted SnoaL-like aldol condensation-catalyzing enzyme
MARDGAHSHGTLQLDTMSIFADDEHAVAIHRATAQIPGFNYHAHEVDVFHINQGKITEMWSFSEDQAATDRIWS